MVMQVLLRTKYDDSEKVTRMLHLILEWNGLICFHIQSLGWNSTAASWWHIFGKLPTAWRTVWSAAYEWCYVWSKSENQHKIWNKPNERHTFTHSHFSHFSYCIWHGLVQIVGIRSSHCVWFENTSVIKLHSTSVGLVSIQICSSIRLSWAQYASFMALYRSIQMTTYPARKYATWLDREALYYAHCVIEHVNIRNFTNRAYFLELLTYLTILQPYSLQYLCHSGVMFFFLFISDGELLLKTLKVLWDLGMRFSVVIFPLD